MKDARENGTQLG